MRVRAEAGAAPPPARTKRPPDAPRGGGAGRAGGSSGPGGKVRPRRVYAPLRRLAGLSGGAPGYPSPAGGPGSWRRARTRERHRRPGRAFPRPVGASLKRPGSAVTRAKHRGGAGVTIDGRPPSSGRGPGRPRRGHRAVAAVRGDGGEVTAGRPDQGRRSHPPPAGAEERASASSAIARARRPPLAPSVTPAPRRPGGGVTEGPR